MELVMRLFHGSVVESEGERFWYTMSVKFFNRQRITNCPMCDFYDSYDKRQTLGLHPKLLGKNPICFTFRDILVTFIYLKNKKPTFSLSSPTIPSLPSPNFLLPVSSHFPPISVTFATHFVSLYHALPPCLRPTTTVRWYCRRRVESGRNMFNVADVVLAIDLTAGGSGWLC